MRHAPRPSASFHTPALAIGLVTALAVAAAPGTTAAASILRPAALAGAATGVNSTVFAVTIPPKSTDAWALVSTYKPGATGTGDSVLHRHKNNWTKVALKGAPASKEFLNGIAAASRKQIWLVGEHLKKGSTSTYLPLLARSTGGAFTPMTLKGFSVGRLIAVAASSASNAWVVAENASFNANLAFHWNGKSWKKIAIPTGSNGSFDQASIATSGPSDTWVLGQGVGSTIDHWNGHKWSAAPLTSASQVANGIATSKGGHAFTVGYTLSGSKAVPLALRWSGSAWTTVALAHSATGEIFDAVAIVGSTAYGVGSHQTSTTSADGVPLAATLHATKGKILATSKVGKFSALQAVAASSKATLAGGDYETAGYCKSPFHSLLESLKHSKWTRVKVPGKLVPASASGATSCA